MDPKIWGVETFVRMNVDYGGSVSMLANGGYVSTWIENSKIWFQLYDGYGVKVGDAHDVGASSVNVGTLPDVQAIGSDGGFVILWNEKVAATQSIYSQKYDYSGSADGGRITVASNTTLVPGVKMSTAATGGWAEVYVDKVNNSNNTVKLTTYGLDGNATTVDVATGTSPDVAYLGGSKYAVIYKVSDSPAQFKFSIVNGGTATAFTLPIDGTRADVVALKDTNGALNGNFAIIAEQGSQATKAYIYDATSNSLGNAIDIGGAKQDSGFDYESATALHSGGFAVVYGAAVFKPDGTPDDLGDIFVKIIAADGTPSDAIRINARWTIDGGVGQHSPSVAEMADGRLAVTWYDGSFSDGNKSALSTTIIDARTDHVKVTGTSHEDVYVGSDFAGDELNGAAGNDVLIGGLGGDTLVGGAGIDTASFQYATAGVVASLKNGGFGGEAASDTYSEIENLLGTNFDDVLEGDDNANVLDGAAGNDILAGGAGADQLIGGAGIDTVSYAGSTEGVVVNLAAVGAGGEAQGDTYSGIENIIGSEHNDTLYGDAGANVIVGGGGDDTYIVDNMADQVVENPGGGTDTVFTWVSYALSPDVENLTATGGAPIALTGNDLNNVITGNGATNMINGGAGADTMIGGGGDDTYIVDNVNDVIVDDSGFDTLILSKDIVGTVSLTNFPSIENVVIGDGSANVNGNDAANSLTGNSFDNLFFGFGGNDTLSGLGGNDSLFGGDGNDVLLGGDGNDSLNGQAGNDTIYGGAGKDVLTGGPGKDVFVFNTAVAKKKNANIDKITDFTAKDDSIYLAHTIFKALGRKGSLTKPVKLDSKMFWKGNAAHDADDHIIVSKSGKVYYDADGTGHQAQIQIGTVTTKAAKGITVKDFFVI